jgi:hypothetical protein
MNKFNNTLAGTDCGDAGLPAHSRAIARAKPVLRAVPNVADNESMSPPTTAVAEPVARPCTTRNNGAAPRSEHRDFGGGELLRRAR